jgi:hypothetical protein
VKTLRATLALYRAVLQDGARAYGRGIIGAFGLLLGSAFLLLVSTVLGPLLAAGGGAGSLLFGLFFSTLMAYVAGAYLACVEAALDARKMVPPSTLKDAIGHYFGECIGVMFWLWIGGLVLSFVLDGMLAVAVWFVVAVLFNPIPEIIYNKRVQAPRIFQDSARWIWSNWPEWFIPQLAIGLLAAAIVPGLADVVGFGGWMGFNFVGVLAEAARDTAGIATLRGAPLWRAILEALVVPLVVHAVMVFRGALFRRLDQGNRRARAWHARFDE